MVGDIRIYYLVANTCANFISLPIRHIFYEVGGTAYLLSASVPLWYGRKHRRGERVGIEPCPDWNDSLTSRLLVIDYILSLHVIQGLGAKSA